MPLTPSNVRRATDATGDSIKTFDDGSGDKIQAAILVDDSAAQVGITSNPLPISDAGGSLTIDVAALPLPSGAATEATLTAIKKATRFYVIFPNHIDIPDSSTIYIGKEDEDGVWLVQKISVSGTVRTFTYATVLNNWAVLTYSAAWAARASTLTYGTFAEAF